MTKRIYDCDTSPYWCSEEDYNNREKTFGSFIEDGKAYRIDDSNTPRPWLNYLSNKKFGSVISNKGLGFSWYSSTLLRITKYEHPIDYLPRDFVDGRDIIVKDNDSGEELNLLKDAKDLICTHRPGSTTLTASLFDTKVELTFFVPETDACEICICRFISKSDKDLTLTFSQIWSFALFGIHTAEDGIPYLSTPGDEMVTSNTNSSITCEVRNSDLPYKEIYGIFNSPNAKATKITPLLEKRDDGRTFTFCQCDLIIDAKVRTNKEELIEVISGAEISKDDFNAMREKYSKKDVALSELDAINQLWEKRIDALSCSIPDNNIQNFLNVWLKNQLHLIFNFVRSGQNGYRDSVQDVWGMILIDYDASLERFIEILSHQCADGTAPRQFSAFKDGKHDMRRFMDSPVWLARTLIDLVKESGDFTILTKEVLFLESDEKATIEEHVFRSLDYLYQHRGAHGICLTGDGDWNDALEGISKDGDAESVWLTIALYDAMIIMNELYLAANIADRAALLAERALELKNIINSVGWDGEWYVYGFTGTGKPIGSKTNKEGKIHLNSQSWAVFSGLADEERAKTAMNSVDKHLNTPLGPVLMHPPYVEEGAEVGRIANLEPGTFENGSIYQHAVTFHIFANIAANYMHPEEAVATFANLLPTNPDNFDARRTSEPYCTGNYYCGTGHARFGQNFFTWFTGNASWLLRAGFDEIIGVKADFNGLKISPSVPDSWSNFSIKRKFRKCTYLIDFKSSKNRAEKSITVDGEVITGNIIPISKNKYCNVKVQI